MLRQYKKKGQSLIEYIMLIVFVLGAFLVFQKYMARGFAGRWKSTGDSFAQGKIYDPRLTTECIYDFQYTNRWYDQACFEASDCDCLSVRQTTGTCQNCILSCTSPRCDS